MHAMLLPTNLPAAEHQAAQALHYVYGLTKFLLKTHNKLLSTYLPAQIAKLHKRYMMCLD
eukprot:1158641-Pelagomonas_calceolata.AAC.1